MDIVVTWPKSRSLQSYLDELERADREDKLINFRISSIPKEDVTRCFMVHDGAVRGYTNVLKVDIYQRGEIRDPITGHAWPDGIYITRDPEWYPIEPIPMKGFQGFRYFKEIDVREIH